ncbi:amino acid ABC transporter permease [Thalassospira mesophila]|uniref:amino acid ABC transporter permease n=1 Tax=Thalassospira mesophila TaxID=1293891 RepID=UPI000A1EB7F8|nr:amino acid ABC transporter permease [Thalassospira mesophila]
MFELLSQPAPDGGTYGKWLLSGLTWTMALAIAGWAIAFAVGVAIGTGRCLSGRTIPAICRVYVEIFRNIPLLVQMFLWYFVLPELLPPNLGDWLKQLAPPWGNFLPAVLCLGLYTASRVAEQVRAGIEALPPGQKEAAIALGLHPRHVQYYVIVPQALRLLIPSLTSEVMGIYKNTSVALTIGVMELTAQARQISEMTFQTFPAFAAVTITYLVLALIVWAGMTWLEHHLAAPTSTACDPRPVFLPPVKEENR